MTSAHQYGARCRPSTHQSGLCVTGLMLGEVMLEV